MTFIVILIALLIERFFDWSHLRQWHWYRTYQRAVMQRLQGQSPYLVLAVTVVSLLLAVLLVECIVKNWLYGMIKLFFMLFIFIYCLGPQNLWADTFSCLQVLSQNDIHAAVEKLKISFGVSENSSSPAQAIHRRLFDHIFIEANCRVFAIIFWFVVLGPIGPVLYRCIMLSSSELSLKETAPDVASKAFSVESILDWVPVRIFTFILGLSGHFANVFPLWSKKALLGVDSNHVLLTECGAASLFGSDQLEIAVDGSAERKVISLLDRAFTITLVIILVVGMIS